MSSITALDAGVTPSVTVSNLDAHTELVLGRDYTVSYSGNRSIGTAHVTVAGLGEYVAFTNNASFLITGITAYYIVGGSSSDATGASTVSGDGDPSGWSATKGAETKDVNGIAAANAIYYIWMDRWVRTPPRKDYATPSTSAIVIEPSCKWELGDKLTGHTLTLNNLSIREGGRLVVSTVGDYDGVSITRSFAIESIGFKSSVFLHSMEIAPTAGKVTNTLTNFPVLVRLSESIRGFHYGDCPPDTLRFTLADGTLLPHEIDWWNENGESTVWVNVLELAADTVIRAHWGSARGPLALPVRETWPEYVGVWHFSEAGGSAFDSSGNGYHTTNNGGGTVSNLNAKVGLARNAGRTAFETPVTKLNQASAAKPISNVAKFTVSGWMYSTENVGVGTAQKYPQMMRNKNNWNDGNGWFTGFESAGNKFNAVGSGGTRTIVTLPASVYDNWVYLTAVFDGATSAVYENGVPVSTKAINAVNANTSYALRFGENLTGRIDEFRIHNRVQDAAYAAADYATQTDPDFLTFGKVKRTAPTMMILR